MSRLAATVTTVAWLAACAAGDPPDLGRRVSAIGTGSGVVTTTPDGSFVPGELMVRLDHALTSDGVVLGGIAFTVVEQMPSGVWRLAIDDLADARTAVLGERALADDDRAAAEATTLDAAAAVAAEPGVLEAYVNIVLTLSAVPSDPLYSSQRWNYEAVNLPAAWDFGFGSPLVELAIIDSEIDADHHPDLVTKWQRSENFITDTFTTIYHHGAHVAGIAGAATGNGVGGAGVCGGCMLRPLRVSARLDTNLAEVERAVHRAGGDDFVAAGTSDAINLSLNARFRPGSMTEHQTCSTPETAAFASEVRRAITNGATVVVSAGNFTDTGPAFPADCPNVISVAAIQPGGTIADYSNRGGSITLAAPGGGGNGDSQFGASAPEMPCPKPPKDVNDGYAGTVGVMSSWVNWLPIEQAVTADYCERYLSGTSMSAPHVTGTVGLMRSRNNRLSPAQVTDILRRTAQTTTPCPPGTCGAGLLDAGLAVRYAPLGGVPVASLPALDLSATVNQTATASASLRNTGSAAMTPAAMTITGGGGLIEFAFPSGPCTSGTVCNQPVPPVVVDQAAAIPLRCKPTAVGTVSATLSIDGDMLRGPARTTVTCTGTPPPDVSVTPTQLEFPGTAVGTSSAAQQVTVSNAGGGNLGVTATLATGNFALACIRGCTCSSNVCTANLFAGNTMTLAVRFTPGGQGAITGQLTLATPADPDEPSTTVALAGTGLVPLIAIHAPSFPITLVGATSTVTAQVSNTGGAPLHVSQLVLSDITGVFTFSGTCDSLRVCPVALDVAPGASSPVTLRFRPVRTATIATIVSATSNAVNGAGSLAIWGQSFAPTVIVDRPVGLDFGSVPVTTSATRDFNILNFTGGRGTTLTWTATIPAPFQLGCLGGSCSCAAGVCSGSTGSAASSLRMTFTPASPGAAAASLVVQSNDPDHPTVQYTASGTGVLVPPGPPRGTGDSL